MSYRANAIRVSAKWPAITSEMFTAFTEWVDRGEATSRTYLSHLRAFLAYLNWKGIAQPTKADVIAYRDWLQREHDGIIFNPDTPQGWSYQRDAQGRIARTKCKPSTVAQYLRSLGQFFKWAAAEGLHENIAETVRKPKISSKEHQRDALTPLQVGKIEKSIRTLNAIRAAEAQNAGRDREGRTQRAEEQGKRLLALYVLAVNAGLRTVELSRADVGHLETRDGITYLRIWGKGRTSADTRKILAPEVAAILTSYLDSRPEHLTPRSPLFSATGNRNGGGRLTPGTISRLLKRAMEEAGYSSERLTAHSLRHSAGSAAMALTGNNIFLTQAYMRHANPATTEIYLHTNTEPEEAETAERVYQLFHSDRQRENDLQERTGEPGTGKTSIREN